MSFLMYLFNNWLVHFTRLFLDLYFRFFSFNLFFFVML
jgi:hypothetical protein